MCVKTNMAKKHAALLFEAPHGMSGKEARVKKKGKSHRMAERNVKYYVYLYEHEYVCAMCAQCA